MIFLKTIFWNKEQDRLRAGFRIILQATIFFVIMKSLKLLIGVPNEITGHTPLWIFLAIAGILLICGWIRFRQGSIKLHLQLIKPQR